MFNRYVSTYVENMEKKLLLSHHHIIIKLWKVMGDLKYTQYWKVIVFWYLINVCCVRKWKILKLFFFCSGLRRLNAGVPIIICGSPYVSGFETLWEFYRRESIFNLTVFLMKWSYNSWNVTLVTMEWAILRWIFPNIEQYKSYSDIHS